MSLVEVHVCDVALRGLPEPEVFDRWHFGTHGDVKAGIAVIAVIAVIAGIVRGVFEVVLVIGGVGGVGGVCRAAVVGIAAFLRCGGRTRGRRHSHARGIS